MKLPKFLSNVERIDVAYAIQVFLFLAVLIISEDKILIVMYGYFATSMAYRRGKFFSEKKAAERFEPLLDRAKEHIDGVKKEITEANNQLAVMKEKLADYENRL